MLSKIILALVLATTAVTTTLPAFADDWDYCRVHGCYPGW
jgi:hypothetical protein